MDLQHISGVARPLDPGYPSNRWIGIVTLAVLALAWLGRGAVTGDWLAAAGWAVVGAVAVFLAWALARELDPDAEGAAFTAAGIMAAALLAAGASGAALPDLAALFVLLLATRVLNRTSGLGASVADGIGLLALGLWLTTQGQPLYLVAGAAALLLDGLLPPRARRRLMVGGAALAVAAVIAAAAPQPFAPAVPHPLAPTWLPLLAALAAALLLLPSVRAAGRMQSTGDATGAPLRPARVRAGQGLALATGLIAVLLQGAAGLFALLPLWAASAGVGGSRLAAGRSRR
jgi:hypothetical protein